MLRFWLLDFHDDHRVCTCVRSSVSSGQDRHAALKSSFEIVLRSVNIAATDSTVFSLFSAALASGSLERQSATWFRVPFLYWTS